MNQSPSFEELLSAATEIKRWRDKLGSPISLETALCFVCGAVECEIIVKQCEFTIRKQQDY